jgi:hypothetical protein
MHAEAHLRIGPRHGAVGLRDGTPAAPRSINEAGLSLNFLVELVAKMLFLGGQLKLTELSFRTKLAATMLDPVLAFMRTERLCEVAQRGAAHGDISYLLTDLGRVRAEDFLLRSQYAGPAPVSLQSYVQQVESQSLLGRPVSRERMRAAFDGCAIGRDLLDDLGIAMNSSRPLFMHGPAGSGKTYAAARLVGVLGGHVYIPYAIAVGSDLVEVFDPLVHKPVGDVPSSAHRMFEKTHHADERWVLCQRPAVVSGGEFAPSMLDLEFDAGRGVHALPAQAKANNGVLIIDDLGRQLVSVRDLLNRWVLPMDSRFDYMTLRSGRRFKIPIDVKVIFCTNLDPSEIGDEAFLRRLGYKIYVGPVEESDYRAIFRDVCEELAIPFSEDGFEHVLRLHRGDGGRPLLASVPLDLLEQLRDCARYHGVSATLAPPLLDWAWRNRFAPDRSVTGLKAMQLSR